MNYIGYDVIVLIIFVNFDLSLLTIGVMVQDFFPLFKNLRENVS